MRSGELAAAAGVNPQTLRYYERRGLLPAPTRSPGGHRVYDDRALATLRVVRAAQRLGFTLREIADLLRVGSHRGPRPGLSEAARAKLAEVEERIADLQLMRTTLLAVVEAECSDLLECSCTPSCPVPFEELALGHAGGADQVRATSR
jgi:DNA-binding transcriptional MerR regulator